MSGVRAMAPAGQTSRGLQGLAAVTFGLIFL